ncbi:Eco57I restriction-modification methylase domain-containing protein [Sphaerotilus sp.]|uniref:Eco57I restriction-modification methylase domain-containing protein n=1 Tax=Sphaerotilus sp. TaxID=2093942 RepID=UPI002ACEF683|nr:Eco57I restriction-modification methylase domain-containing protein [Sphaerotilus sp.]MDZ7856536.1 Eco57I restriction-modification methylase domain-containing protein [Sphaerotilus sp.]
MPPPALLIDQPSLDGFCPIAEAVELLAQSASTDARGAVYTRREVVEFMLDLAGYTPDRPLYRMKLLEPSFGSGEFLLAAARRLMASAASAYPPEDLADCIRAVELHRDTFDRTKTRLSGLLSEFGLEAAERSRLLSTWLVCADFLLSPMPDRFDVVVGNPPYVRQELIPAALLAQYRLRYTTLYDRADLYVPFIERSLSLLAERGQLAFICANRWTKNQYGRPLRAMVAEGFHLRAYVDMVDTPAFDAEVIAYPAITLIEKTSPGATLVATQPDIQTSTLTPLAQALRGDEPRPELGVSLVERVGTGDAPWVLSSSDRRVLLRRLEALFPTLEEAGCKVGIGVATGADKAFIGPMDTLDVEPSRKLALVTTKDIASGFVRWRGLGVINPFEDDGRLVDLAQYPRLSAHLDRHRDVITKRHVAQKSPASWYRTIDRITPSLAARPKLLIPDIKGSAHVVFEEGWLYPHHNLYFVASEEWDLRALQAVLLSCVARQFITAYSTTMHGGFLRYQAQYLRRIRLPRWESVPEPMRAKLAMAAQALDIAACDQAACELYGLTSTEAHLLAQG